MLKKSTSFASSALISAAAGVSIIMPTSIFGSKGTPAYFSSACTSRKILRALRTSSTLIIIGNITASLP